MAFAGHQLIDGSGDALNVATKVINIGDWNMDSTASISVAHGLDVTKIVSVIASIRNDADTLHYPLTTDAGGVGQGSITSTDATNVNMTRANAGTFDSADFDSTTYNRGWVTLIYTY